ncbi:MAG: glycosyltransferase family 9 protein [Rikenellaceae bacterium]
MPKFLIIRLSSIGDIIQCMSIIGGIRQHFPDAEIHWLTRSDMADTVSIDRRIDKIWSFDKKEGFDGLRQISRQLKAEDFDYVYDAHCNLRSKVVKSILRCRVCHRPKIVVRRKNRFRRQLLFRFGVNCFQWPFIGVDSYRKPLKRWGITQFDDSFDELHFPAAICSKTSGYIGEGTITIVPSANWEMKRWPVSHWCRLVELLPDYRFVILAGPTDTFCEDIRAVAPDRVVNLAGRCSIMESSCIVSQSKIVISGDTGFLHSADQFKVPALALMGPTAFGFPARESSEVIALDMKCRPCTKDGRGECKDSVYRRCMVDITPECVAQRVQSILPLV